MDHALNREPIDALFGPHFTAPDALVLLILVKYSIIMAESSDNSPNPDDCVRQ